MKTNHIERMAQESLRKQRNLLAKTIELKDKVSDLADKKLLEHMAKQIADELSVPYQTDLTEE